MTHPTYFPLRWETTGDQWWFASPIDLAAANGHYDLVRELLYIDTNLLIKLTSLPRIRRLETVWDDDATFAHVAKCRSQVARKLLLGCEKRNGHNSLIRAGYGGWLLYTAASAGDMPFVKELLQRDPLLVFGEREYGVTDMFYAAARSGNSEVFMLLFDSSLSARGQAEPSSGFKAEMVNRSVHAAARGGNVGLLVELLGDGADVLGFRDVRGSTLLHTAAGRGQLKVVRHLISSYEAMIESVDNRGNTALNIAAYRGHLPVVELLTRARPSTASLTNNSGNTFLHMAVLGFLAPGFKRLDRQLELMKQLVSGSFVSMEDVVNVKNKEGRTALHMAVIENLQSQVVELLMSMRYINLNIRDSDGNTPLDLLKQRPHSASSEILIRRLIAAGGIENSKDQTTRNALVSHLRRHGIGGSPGTSFRIPDAEILLHTGTDDIGPSSCDLTSSEFGYSCEIERVASTSSKYNKMATINSAAKRFKNLLLKKARDGDASDMEDDYSFGSPRLSSGSKNSPISLRQQFSKQASLPNNKRTQYSLPAGTLPSPSTKKKFAAGLSQGVLQLLPKSYAGSPSSAYSESSWSSPLSADKGKSHYHRSGSDAPHSPNSGSLKMKHNHPSFNLKLMNNYFCFGAQGLAVDNSITSPRPSQSQHRLAA
ncbi:hypothetical protein SASPL_107337 [Salvia splendens]|uniref:Uncharacterized protein n=1 Tax=Salvia splendens TaxID=180675 RepID=A0A8X8YCR5_SALSN|nr:uncharacterized protein LOC121794531 [Salvia splendens]KAG6429289.1 hypothetical protein SASPL_107337 [Salvia splendens]